VGKRRLEAALAQSTHQQFDVRWRPFQLNEQLPKGQGLSKLQYYKDRFGPERVEQMIPQMKQVGLSVQINFNYGGFIGNTLDSHRLIWKAREMGGSALQDKMVEAIFKAYFEQEKSLGDAQVLRECAQLAGMPVDEVETLLRDESIGANEVKREEREFRTRWNCRGVPLFIIDGKFQLSGAQPIEQLLEVFKKLDE
jgi:predicted DsbA family dithiol-disulfide isomerase